jgi:hypothetical protein
VRTSLAVAFFGFGVLVTGLIWSRSWVTVLLVVAGLALIVAGGLRDDGATS